MIRYARLDPPRPAAARATSQRSGGELLMDLQTLWFVLIAVLWAGYFLLEGFDFGVGMLLPFVPSRRATSAGAMLETIGPVWDGNEVWLVVAGGATFAAFPGLVRDDVLRVLPRPAARARLPHRPRRLVRVAGEERDARAGGRSGRGRTRSAASAPRSSGASGSRTSSTESRSTPTATSPATSRISSARTPSSPGSRSCCCSRSTARRFLTLRTTGDLHERAPTAARRLAIPAALVGGCFLAWTVAVAIDRNDKDLFPPVLPAALGIAALAARRRFVFHGRSGRAFAMTGARHDRRSSRRCSRASTRASWSRAPTSRTASRSTTPRRRTTRSQS